MDANSVGGILFIIVGLIAAIACVPPFIQSKQENYKPGQWFSIACFSICIYIVVKMCLVLIRS